jgi:hypothetical protein
MQETTLETLERAIQPKGFTIYYDEDMRRYSIDRHDCGEVATFDSIVEVIAYIAGLNYGVIIAERDEDDN